MRLFSLSLAVAVLAVASPMPASSAERGSVVLPRVQQDEGSEYPPATFSHSVHRYQYKCHVCHDAIFKMKKGTNKVTMQEIENGKFCGTCHNDTIAFGTNFDSCQRCHH